MKGREKKDNKFCCSSKTGGKKKVPQTKKQLVREEKRYFSIQALSDQQKWREGENSARRFIVFKKESRKREHPELTSCKSSNS